MSYQSHMRAVVSGLALYMWTLYLAQAIVKSEIKFVHIVAIEEGLDGV